MNATTKPLSDTESDHTLAHTEEEVRADMAEAVEHRILRPLNFLASLLTELTEGSFGSFPVDNELLCRNVGNLLLLVTAGARKELEIQRTGGDAAYALKCLVDSIRSEATRKGNDL